MSRNADRHHEFRFDDGETFVESCRNTIGGFANAMRRVEDRFGERPRPECSDASDPACGRFWTVAGRRFEIVEVQKVGR